MKAIILAAGQGIRLRPHTNDKPKCMVKLAGKPLLYWQLRCLRSVRIEKILLVGGYCADRLEAKDVELATNPRYAETNMVTTLFCAEDWMTPGEDLLIAYGDIVYERRVLQRLIETDAPIAISIDRQWQRLWKARMEDPLNDAETLKLKDGNRIAELGKKPSTFKDIEGQYLGLIKVRGDNVEAFRAAWHALDRNGCYDGKNFDNMYMTSFIQNLIDTGHDVRAAFTESGWIEVDTAEDLALYETLHREGGLDHLLKLD